MLRTIDRAPLGPILAPMFGLALAFALSAIPAGLLPLGEDGTRAVLVAVSALVGGAAVWSLFAWLDRPRRHARHKSATFTLRAADAHPDAPPRRPIFAAADLGAPLDEAPQPAWPEEVRRLAAGPPSTTAANDELLLDSPVEEPAAREDAASSADLMRRLEEGLTRRGGRAPIADPRLREALGRLQARFA